MECTKPFKAHWKKNVHLSLAEAQGVFVVTG